MDIDLRLPSGEHDKEIEEEPNIIDGIMVGEDKPINADGVDVSMEIVEAKLLIEAAENEDASSLHEMDFKEATILEPLPGMEFASHGDAYAYYQEYARSTGFNTAIQNSRRSKTSREFIDAKFACSRYGTKREYEKFLNRPRSRQGGNLDPDNASGRRACSKTDCKASMHVKRRSDGKWIIHRFEKDHNHELLPAQAVSEQTRRMYAAMARQFAEYKTAVCLNHDSRSQSEKSRNVAIDAEAANSLIDFFVQMQSSFCNFFYAIDIGEDQRPRNFLWVDGKSRHDYGYFSDVISFDTSYVKNKYKMPLALFVGVNQHYQFMLLGCALLSDESTSTFSWVMKNWLKAMGGQPPKIIITDQDKGMKPAVSEVFPSTLHYFGLWQIFGKVSESLSYVIKQNESFMPKLEKCVYRSWTEEEFDRRWNKLVERFGLKENELFRSLYEDRSRWVPNIMKDGFFAGMASGQRSESVNSFFDKYVHRKTTLQEFMKQYEAILQDRYEEEVKAASDTWNKQPAMKSPSPIEKHVAGIYTNAVFRKFQVEVLGAVACMPKGEDQVGTAVKFRVHDFDMNQEFIVTLNEPESEICCICRLFEFRGFLCRHAMLVLQIRGISTIPYRYILKRWTKDAKTGFSPGEGTENPQSRFQRFNDLCHKAMKLSEEGSLSQESYRLTVRALDDAFENCSNSNKNLHEAASPGVLCIEEDLQSGSLNKSNKKKASIKKRKVNMEPEVMPVCSHETLQQMDKMSARTVSIDGFFGHQPTSVQGMVRKN
ncbi:hypothetical protein M569_17367, partial [Genlisea aurea]